MSLRLRLVLTCCALVVTIVSVFAAILYTTMRRNLQTEMDRRLRLRASQVELTIWPGATSLTAQDITSAKLDLSPLDELDAPGVYVQVVDRQGGVVARSSNLGKSTLPSPSDALTGALDRRRTLSTASVGSDRSVRILSQPIMNQGSVIGVLEVGQSRQPLQQTLDDLRVLLLLVGAGLLLVGAAVVWLVTLRGLRPLQAISRQARRISEEQSFAERIPLATRRDEIGQLARTINELLQTVDDLLRQHREFVADTSHELRNPLLALRTNLDILERIDDPEQRRECLEEAREQSERMTRLVSDVLLLARAESTQLIAADAVALGPLLENVAESARRRAGGRTIQLEQSDPVTVRGDAGRVRQVLTNLIKNAIEHTPPDGTITLGLRQTDGWACLAVRDDGEGIAASALPHIFERFYRADPRRRQGTGLGLAIVKHLVEAHGGRVSVESALGRGSCFTIWLPVLAGNESAVLAPPLPPAVVA
jgi:two-component system, OmpR family, sensor kinase